MSKDLVKSAGIADGTGVDTFMRMQGKQTFLVEDDLSSELTATGDLLHDTVTGELVGGCQESEGGSFY